MSDTSSSGEIIRSKPVHIHAMNVTSTDIPKKNNLDHLKKGKDKQIARELHDELIEGADIDLTGVDIESMSRMIKEFDIARIDTDDYKSRREIISQIISERDMNGSFALLDIGAIIRQYRLWRRYLPNVDIFYAVKCNPNPIILRTLANLGVGFDVASAEEINMALEALEVIDAKNSDKIIYANPCKREEFISYARSQNVNLMTFDNNDELLKITRLHPTARLLLRITVDDLTNSKMKFGSKFGCPTYMIKTVLKFAKILKLNVVGVSFHVGSGCIDGKSYYNAIKRAKKVFDVASKIGYIFNVLDIGGGFPGTEDSGSIFSTMADQIHSAINDHFSDCKDLRIISEPGRFFATSVITYVVRITSKKPIMLAPHDKKDNFAKTETFDLDKYLDDFDEEEQKFGDSETHREHEDHKELQEFEDRKALHYFVDSGLYGVFNNLVFDHATIEFKLLNEYGSDKTYPSVVFGETCDSMDKIVEGVLMPELVCGDYMYCENHGAYTVASASSFNGFPIKKPVVIFSF